MARFDWRIARNVLLLCCLLTMPGAGDPPRPGKVLDEARQAGRSCRVAAGARRRTISTTWMAAPI